MSSVNPRFLTEYDVGDWCLRGYTEELQKRARGDPHLTRFHWDELHVLNRAEALRKFEENSKQCKQDLATKAREGLEKNIDRELCRIVEIYENNQRSETMKTMLDQSKQSNKEMNTMVGSLAAQDERLNAELYANQQRLQHLNDSYQTAKKQLDMNGLDSMRAELEFRQREGDSVEATNRAAEAALHDQNQRIEKMMQQLDQKQKKTFSLPYPLSLFSRNSSYSETVETTTEETEKTSNNGHQQKLTQKYEIQKCCQEEEITLKIKFGDPFVEQDQNEIPFTGMMQIQNDTLQNILNGQDEITLKMKVDDFLGRQLTTINEKMHIEKKKSPLRDQQISKAEISKSEQLKEKTQDNFGTLLSQIKSGLSVSFARSFKENN